MGDRRYSEGTPMFRNEKDEKKPAEETGKEQSVRK